MFYTGSGGLTSSVFTQQICFHPCPFVGTSEGLRKNYATDFRETWMEGGSGFKMDLSIFELDSSLYLTF